MRLCDMCRTRFDNAHAGDVVEICASCSPVVFDGIPVMYTPNLGEKSEPIAQWIESKKTCGSRRPWCECALCVDYRAAMFVLALIEHNERISKQLTDMRVAMAEATRAYRASLKASNHDRHG